MGNISTIWEFRDLLEAGGSLHFTPCLGIAGGFTRCKKIAALADSYFSALVSHNFLGPLLMAASVYLDVATPNFITREYLMLVESAAPADAVFKTTLKRVGGYMLAPETVGIGVVLDDHLVHHADFKYLPRQVQRQPDGSPAMAV